jgi:hypothetical protein
MMLTLDASQVTHSNCHLDACDIAYGRGVDNACLRELKHEGLEGARSFGGALRKSFFVFIVLQLFELLHDVGVTELPHPRLARVVVDAFLQNEVQSLVVLCNRDIGFAFAFCDMHCHWVTIHR